MNSSGNVLSVANLSKTYGEIRALENVDFSVRQGEFVSIIGRNGSGKSTLLKIIAGILAPTSGSVTAPESAYLPQDHALLPWRTVEENLLLPSDIKKIPRSTIREKAGDLLAEFGLKQFKSI